MRTATHAARDLQCREEPPADLKSKGMILEEVM